MLRRQDSTGGVLPPVTNAIAHSAPSGASAAASAMAASPSGDTMAQGSSTAACPARSINRPSIGVTIATPAASAAATTPAAAYEPISRWMNTTMASVTMPIGSTATSVAATSGRTRCARRTRR